MRAVPDEVAHFAKRHDAQTVLFQPTHDGPLIPLLMRLHDDHAVGTVLVVADLVWMTAPGPDLLKAFAPPAGREKVRPIEGYEMQAEHAGFSILDKLEVPRESWNATLTATQRAALDADLRGAAKLMAWALRREA